LERREREKRSRFMVREGEERRGEEREEGRVV